MVEESKPVRMEGVMLSRIERNASEKMSSFLSLLMKTRKGENTAVHNRDWTWSTSSLSNSSSSSFPGSKGARGSGRDTAGMTKSSFSSSGTISI